MSEFAPVFEEEGEWSAINPLPTDTRSVTRVPVGSISNDHLAGGISPLKIQIVVIKVTQTAGQSVGDAAETVVQYATESLNEGFAPLDTSTRTVTLPYSGMYLFTVRGQWASNGTGRRRITVQVDTVDTDIQDHQHVGGVVTHVSATTGVNSYSAGQVVRVRVFQNSTAALSLDDSQLSIIFLGPV